MTDSRSHIYGQEFLSYATVSSAHAAAVVARLFRSTLPIASVLDVGCAEGVWLNAWRDSGASEIAGVDGAYVERAKLRIPADCFTAADLANPFDLGRRYDLVQSLEVAEHLPPRAAEAFVANLVRHARGLVLFSAAPPGQGGEHHVNEQPYEYWRALFRRYRFSAYDFVRPAIGDDRRISFWYRYNVFLYASDDAAGRLPEAIGRAHVPDAAPLRDVSPPLFKARKLLVRSLPSSLQAGLARLKAASAIRNAR